MLSLLVGIGAMGVYKEIKPKPKRVIAKRKKKGGVRKVRVYRYTPA